MCYWRSLIIEMIRHIAHLKDCFFYGAARYKYVAPLEQRIFSLARAKSVLLRWSKDSFHLGFESHAI